MGVRKDRLGRPRLPDHGDLRRGKPGTDQSIRRGPPVDRTPNPRRRAIEAECRLGRMCDHPDAQNGKPVQLPIRPEILQGLERLPEVEYFFWVGSGESEILRRGLAADVAAPGRDRRGPHTRSSLAPYVRDGIAFERRAGFRRRGDFREQHAHYRKALLPMDSGPARFRFAHRKNDYGTFDSICPTCFLTIATEPSEPELTEYEELHDCLLLAKEKFGESRRWLREYSQFTYGWCPS